MSVPIYNIEELLEKNSIYDIEKLQEKILFTINYIYDIEKLQEKN